MTLGIQAAAMEAMRAHAESGYPEEVCGAVFATPDGQQVRRLTNVQNRLHAEDPVANPRDARTAYHMDARELLDVHRDGDRPGWRILLFYHSHPEHDAYFSATDKAQALWGEGDAAEPSYPGVGYLVFSVRDRRVRDARLFAWSDEHRDFVERPLKVLA